MDPLSDIVSLLKPKATTSKTVLGAGPWRIRREDSGRPFYCVVLEGTCLLGIDSGEHCNLVAGDFALVPEAFDFTVTSADPIPADGLISTPVAIEPGRVSVGAADAIPNTRLLVGHCQFGSPDATILVSLLPRLVHICGATRLTKIVELVIEESREDRPGRELVLAHFLEILFIEAFRTTLNPDANSGLIKGLADERLAIAIRKMHQDVNRSWTVARLAKEAALSRSAFFQRFSKTVGLTPMEYLRAWRMAIAKDLLRRQMLTMAEIAEQIGYQSASAFSVAFTQNMGLSPSKFRAESRVLANGSSST